MSKYLETQAKRDRVNCTRLAKALGPHNMRKLLAGALLPGMDFKTLGDQLADVGVPDDVIDSFGRLCCPKLYHEFEVEEAEYQLVEYLAYGAPLH